MPFFKSFSKGRSKSVFVSVTDSLKAKESKLITKFAVFSDLHITQSKPQHVSHLKSALTDVVELITGSRRVGVIATFSTLIKKSISGVMAALVGFTLQGFGLVTGDTVSNYEKTTGTLFTQTDSAVLGVRICVAVIPIFAAIIALILLKNFKMTKDDHTMIRAAIATKKKHGSVTLTDEEKKRCELISGQKFENTWLGQNNEEEHLLEKNEKGEYLILLELKREKEAINND